MADLVSIRWRPLALILARDCINIKREVHMQFGDNRINPVKRFNGFSSWANSQIYKFFHWDWHFHDTLINCVRDTEDAGEAAKCLFFTLLGMMDEDGEIRIQGEKVVDVMEMEYVRYPEIVSIIWREVR